MNLVMETERKKRRLSYDEEDEDVKMERFFALIRSAKDIRDRLLDKEEPKPRDKKKATIAPKSTTPPATAAKAATPPATAAKSATPPATAVKSATILTPATATKTPSFQPADFGVVAGLPKTDMMIVNKKEKQVEAVASTSRRSEERENEKGEDDEKSDNRSKASRPVIDLNLSL